MAVTREGYESVYPDFANYPGVTLTAVNNRFSAVPAVPDPVEPPNTPTAADHDVVMSAMSNHHNFDISIAMYTYESEGTTYAGVQALAVELNLWPQQIEAMIAGIRAMYTYWQSEQ